MTYILIHFIEQNINLFQQLIINFSFIYFQLQVITMKEEAKRLFYIGKQIKCSNRFQQIISGLQKSREFIREVSILQCLNTLIMSLINLFTETSFSYIRKQITAILLQASSFIAQLPSRQDIITSLTQKLKSSDFLIRILTLQIIEGLHKLFHKDTSVYHCLFSKLKWKKQLAQKQNLMIIRALRSLLQNSQYLAQVFHNNIKQLIQLGQIKVKIIIYLCLHAKFEAKSYESVISTLWQVCLERKVDNNKIIQLYFTKLLIKACRINYFCVQMYLKSFKDIFPQLQREIRKIQWESYNFLQQAINPNNNVLYCQKQILDYCYQYYNIENELTKQMNELIINQVIGDINGNNLTYYTVLLTFYMTRQTRQINQFDQIFVEKLSFFKIDKSSQFKQYKKLLRIALVTANYKLSQQLIKYLLNTNSSNNCLSALMLLTSYVEWRLSHDGNKFYIFLRVLENLAETSQNGRQRKLIELSSLWRNEYKNNLIEGGEMVGYGVEQQNSMRQQRMESLIKNKQVQIECQQQLKFVGENKFIMAPLKLKNQAFNKIYFTKKTISDLFLYL